MARADTHPACSRSRWNTILKRREGGKEKGMNEREGGEDGGMREGGEDGGMREGGRGERGRED